MKNSNNTSLFQREQVRESLKQSLIKLHPGMMMRNPIMFTVEIATMIMLLVTVYSLFSDGQGDFLYNFLVFVILFLTLLFANFAEAIAEARGKAQADSLRRTREETPAKLIVDGTVSVINSSQLKKGDYFECVAGDIIPADGEVVEGLASIDESAITGESAPVIRESGGDKSSVTGGTKVLSDRIKVLVTARPGESFLDKMIALVEGASRQKTPNEIALTILLAVFYPGFPCRLHYLEAGSRLFRNGNQHCRPDFPVRMSHSYDYRRIAFCDRHCRNESCLEGQCYYEVREGCGDGRGHQHPPA